MSKKLAIVGSGPAAFYTLLRVLKKAPDVHVDMFEKSPVPFGLTRFGVAPDHPEVKNCQERFTEIAENCKNFKYWGNVEVGKDLALQDLASNYNALLLSYGAESDRQLGILGENLPGIYSARQLVGWYNGAPDCQHYQFDKILQAARKATIIGNGNVSLDVARMLLGGKSRMEHTDITQNALDALDKCNIEHVDIVARRGAIHSAFTNKELRELQGLENVHMLEPDPQPIYSGDTTSLSRQEKRKLSLLERNKIVSPDTNGTGKSWKLKFYLSPKQFTGSDHVTGIDWTVTKPDPHNPTKVINTEQHVSTPSDIVFKSIGYRSVPLPGMEQLGIIFDPRTGTVVNNHGLASANSGIYVAGWLKTGPVGTIATTMMDAFSVGEEIGQFLISDKRESCQGRESISKFLQSKAVVSWKDWQEIDSEEKRRGASENKPREKFTSPSEILRFLGK